MQHEILQVEDDVGDVFLHAVDRVELVERVVEADLRDRGTRDRREQRAPQAVAERVTEARLERRDDERCVLPSASPSFDSRDAE